MNRLKHDLTYALSHTDICNVVGARIPAHVYPSLKKFKDIDELFTCPATGIEYNACMILYQTGHRGQSKRGHWCCLTRTPIDVKTAKLEMRRSGIPKKKQNEILSDISNGNNVCINFYDSYGMNIDNQLSKIPATYRRQTGQTKAILRDLLDKSDYPLINFSPYRHQSYSIRLPNGQRTYTAVCGRHCSNYIKSGMTPEQYHYNMKSLKASKNMPSYDRLIIELI